LLIAAGTGLTEVCQSLLDYGADKDVKNINDHGAYVPERILFLS
jgi:ankyrin repeat protein